MSRSPPFAAHVSVRLLVPAFRQLREADLDVEALAREAGLPGESLSDPDLRIPGKALYDFLTLATERSGDPAFGLHAGQRLRPGDIGLLEYLVRMSATPEEIAQKLAQYHRLAGNLQPEIERQGDTVVCRLPIPRGDSIPPVVEEYNLSFWAKLARTIQGEDMRPLRVMFTHAKTGHAEETERVFGAPVQFRSPANGLVFGLDALTKIGSPVDSGLQRAVAERADEALAELEIGSESPVSTRVRAQLRRQLRGDGVSAESIAKALGMSVRTLRRRLESEGERFQDLRDDVRKQAALEALRDRRLAISEIAYLLGFGETSAFHRAFRRWTGKTPASFRQAHQDSAAASEGRLLG